MRPLPRYSLGILTTAFLSQGLMISAVAADQNTYRPGQAYMKTAANSHETCAQQCQGDAQCRGWNFVRPNPRTATGICEFNARVAQPVSSAISVSGEVVTSVDPLMSRAIPAGSRTRRVGTPTVEQRKPATPAQRPTQIRRMPVPTPQGAVRPAAHTRPTAPNVRQPKVYGGEKQAAPRQPIQQPALSPQQQQYRQQFLAERQRMEQFRAQQQAAIRQQQLQRSQMARPPAAAPGPYGPQLAPQPQAPVNAAPLPQRQPLYGSLHDDLTKDMTPVARPETAPDNLQNPDAPISTSRAAPAKPVDTAPLTNPVIPGLAGAN